MNLRDLKTDTPFRFLQSFTVWFYRGNGWYGFPYSGGPYCADDNPAVVIVDNQGRDLSYSLRPLRYSDEDEFLAFDGRILAVGNPDGSTE